MKQSIKIHYDQSGKPLRMMGIVQDITEQVAAREELAVKHAELLEVAGQFEESRNMLELIIESAPIRVFGRIKSSALFGL